VLCATKQDGRAQSGLGSIGGSGQQGGGQHVMERNLDRLTIVVAVLYLVTTLTLAKIFE
jgi:protein translocase SecG subunit